MAQPYVTGPCHSFVSVGGSSWRYLGTYANGLTTFDFIPLWEEVPNDIGGSQGSLFNIYEGEEGMAGGPLTRWNEPTLALWEDLPGPVQRTRGVDAPGDIGTVVELESRTQTFIQFPYGLGGPNAKAAMATLPVGYLFFNSILKQRRRAPIGTGMNQVQMLWHNKRFYDATGTVFGVTGGVLCYTTSGAPSGLPSID